MASNLDYLDPALVPIEEKVNSFLEAEKALNRAKVARKNGPTYQQIQAASQPEQRSVESLERELAKLEQEIIEMLPTRNEWLKVNLGYGPSRVGAWHVPALQGAPERYELRVVH